MTTKKRKVKKTTARGRHYSDAMLFMFAGALMRTCEVCVVPDEEIPASVGWLNSATTPQQGGICTLFFRPCNAPDFEQTSEEEWQDEINAGDIIVMRDCSMEVDLATEPTTVTRGCAAEERVTSRTMTLNFSDIADNASRSHAAFWQYCQKYPKAFKVAFATYDGTLYPFNTAVINPGLTIGNNLDDFKNQNGTIQWKKLTNDIPLAINWSPSDLIIPNCTASINFLSFVGGDLTLQVVPRLSEGAVSATYAWTVNAAPDPSTLSTITVVGAVSGDTIVVTVTDNLGCVSTASYIVPA